MELVKHTTEHLSCNLAEDEKGNLYYQIWEKGKDDKPIVLYIDYDDIRISEDLPKDITEYERITELAQMINFLNRMGME